MGGEGSINIAAGAVAIGPARARASALVLSSRGTETGPPVSEVGSGRRPLLICCRTADAALGAPLHGGCA